MDFRVELIDQAKSDISAIHAWLVAHEAGEAGARWFASLRQAIINANYTPYEAHSYLRLAKLQGIEGVWQGRSRGAAVGASREVDTRQAGAYRLLRGCFFLVSAAGAADTRGRSRVIRGDAVLTASLEAALARICQRGRRGC